MKRKPTKKPKHKPLPSGAVSEPTMIPLIPRYGTKSVVGATMELKYDMKPTKKKKPKRSIALLPAWLRKLIPRPSWREEVIEK